MYFLNLTLFFQIVHHEWKWPLRFFKEITPVRTFEELYTVSIDIVNNVKIESKRRLINAIRAVLLFQEF